MSDIERIAAELDALWGGQTLATLRDEAASELNGTCFKSLRTPNGPRRFLLTCVTGEYEQRKAGKLSPNTQVTFGDWSSVSIFEAVFRAMTAGGFIYAFDSESSHNPPALVFIAAVPDSITVLERVFALPP